MADPRDPRIVVWLKNIGKAQDRGTFTPESILTELFKKDVDPKWADDHDDQICHWAAGDHPPSARSDEKFLKFAQKSASAGVSAGVCELRGVLERSALQECSRRDVIIALLALHRNCAPEELAKAALRDLADLLWPRSARPAPGRRGLARRSTESSNSTPGTLNGGESPPGGRLQAPSSDAASPGPRFVKLPPLNTPPGAQVLVISGEKELGKTWHALAVVSDPKRRPARPVYVRCTDNDANVPFSSITRAIVDLFDVGALDLAALFREPRPREFVRDLEALSSRITAANARRGEVTLPRAIDGKSTHDIIVEMLVDRGRWRPARPLIVDDLGKADAESKIAFTQVAKRLESERETLPQLVIVSQEDLGLGLGALYRLKLDPPPRAEWINPSMARELDQNFDGKTDGYLALCETIGEFEALATTIAGYRQRGPDGVPIGYLDLELARLRDLLFEVKVLPLEGRRLLTLTALLCGDVDGDFLSRFFDHGNLREAVQACVRLGLLEERTSPSWRLSIPNRKVLSIVRQPDFATSELKLEVARSLLESVVGAEPRTTLDGLSRASHARVAAQIFHDCGRSGEAAEAHTGAVSLAKRAGNHLELNAFVGHARDWLERHWLRLLDLPGPDAGRVARCVEVVFRNALEIEARKIPQGRSEGPSEARTETLCVRFNEMVQGLKQRNLSPPDAVRIDFEMQRAFAYVRNRVDQPHRAVGPIQEAVRLLWVARPKDSTLRARCAELRAIVAELSAPEPSVETARAKASSGMGGWESDRWKREIISVAKEVALLASKLGKLAVTRAALRLARRLMRPLVAGKADIAWHAHLRTEAALETQDGWVRWREGWLSEALRSHLEARSAASVDGDTRLVAWTLVGAGHTLIEQGPHALHRLEHYLELVDRESTRMQEAALQGHLHYLRGCLLVRRGIYKQLFHERKYRHPVALQMLLTGADDPGAERYITESEELFNHALDVLGGTHPFESLYARYRMIETRLLLAKQNHIRDHRLAADLRTLLEFTEEHHFRREHGIALRLRGVLEGQGGEASMAVATLTQARRELRKVGDRVEAARAALYRAVFKRRADPVTGLPTSAADFYQDHLQLERDAAPLVEAAQQFDCCLLRDLRGVDRRRSK